VAKGGKLTVRELLVRFGVLADTKKLQEFDDAVESAKEHMDGASAAAGRMRDHVMDLVTWLKRAALAGAALAAGLVAQSLATAKHASEIERQAKAMGLTTDAYQELAGVADQFGIDSSNLADLVNTVADKALQAGAGGKEAADAFGLLGISVEDLEGKKPVELMEVLADGIASTTDDTKRLAAASRLFGDDLGRVVLPMLQGGSAKFRLMRNEVAELGGVMDEAAIKRGVEFRKEWRRLGVTVQSVRDAIGVGLLPILTRLAQGMAEYLKANREVIRQDFERVAQGIGRALEFVRDRVYAIDRLFATSRWIDRLKLAAGFAAALAGAFVVFKGSAIAGNGLLALFRVAMAVGNLVAAAAPVVASLGTMGGFLGAVSAAGATLGTFATGLGLVTAAIVGTAATLTVALAPWVLFGSVIAAAALQVDDLLTYLRGGKSIIGTFIDEWAGSNTVLGAVARNLHALIQLGVALWNVLKPLGDAVVVLAEDAFAKLRTKLGEFVDYVMNSALVQWFVDLANNGVQFLIDKLNALTTIITVATAGLNRIAQPLDAAFGDAETPEDVGRGARNLRTSAALNAALARTNGQFAPTSAPGSAAPPASRSTSVRGGDIVIQGVGVSAEQAAAMGRQHQEFGLRAALSSFVGGDE
jgi:hypothetical protein